MLHVFIFTGIVYIYILSDAMFGPQLRIIVGKKRKSTRANKSIIPVLWASATPGQQ